MCALNAYDHTIDEIKKECLPNVIGSNQTLFDEDLT